MRVDLIDEFNAISNQEFSIKMTNTPPKFLIENLPNILVQMNKTSIYNLTSIIDDEDHPITIKISDLNNQNLASTNQPPRYIKIN
jgi:hypothetical protein